MKSSVWTMVRQWQEAIRGEGRILAGFLVACLILLAFCMLASEVMEGDTLAFDRHLITALRSSDNPAIPIGPGWLTSAMLDITAMGGVTALSVLTAIVAGFLLAARKAATAAFLVGAVVGGALVGTLLKFEFQRPRPEVVAHLVVVNSSSFPSGHAMNSAIVYLTLGALLARTQTEHHVRVYILSVAILLTLAIGFSRVYLGVHWPSDVIAGWMVGGTWAILCWVVARSLQHRHAIEPAMTTKSDRS